METIQNYLNQAIEFFNTAQAWAESNPIPFSIACMVLGLFIFFLAIRGIARRQVLKRYALYQEMNRKYWYMVPKKESKALGLRHKWGGLFSLIPEFGIYTKTSLFRKNLVNRVNVLILEPGEFNPEDVDDSYRSYQTEFKANEQTYTLIKQYHSTNLKRIIFITIIILALIAGGYFGYQWYQNRDSGPEMISDSSVGGTHETVEMVTVELTPTPEPLVIDEGNAAILRIDLDRQAPETVNELLEWLNDRMPEINIPIPAFDIDLPNWLVDLFTRGTVTVIVLPEGLDGFVFIEHSSNGSTVYRTDDNLQKVGEPITIMANKLTVTAGNFQWGIEYSQKNSEWKPPTKSAKGNVIIEVTEFGQPALIVHPQGWVYHFVWWHAAILVAILAIAFFVYRRYQY